MGAFPDKNFTPDEKIQKIAEAYSLDTVDFVRNTTTTRLHVFALSGESYDVTLYRGGKAETHTVTVTVTVQ